MRHPGSDSEQGPGINAGLKLISNCEKTTEVEVKVKTLGGIFLLQLILFRGLVLPLMALQLKRSMMLWKGNGKF